MSDTPPECNSNSKSNLIEVQHVGVTAKLQSPLKNLLLNYSSSTETDNNQSVFQKEHHHNSNSRYSKLRNDTAMETGDSTVTDNSKILYEMKSLPNTGSKKGKNKLTLTPSKIEFQLYTKKTSRRSRNVKAGKHSNKTIPKRKLFESESNHKQNRSSRGRSIFQSLRQSFNEMKYKYNADPNHTSPVDKIFDHLPEPETLANNSEVPKREVRIGIYPFDHGCAEYLKTQDCPPHTLSIALAQRTSDYATHFWAEVFGSLHIGVTFLVTFILQSYRFILYSLINTLMVGMLQMTSDYLIKPLLTVLFNGYLQPPLIFCLNILSSIRDMLQPIADAVNSFMKPVATVGRSVRLVHVTYNKKNITKNV